MIPETIDLVQLQPSPWAWILDTPFPREVGTKRYCRASLHNTPGSTAPPGFDHISKMMDLDTSLSMVPSAVIRLPVVPRLVGAILLAAGIVATQLNAGDDEPAVGAVVAMEPDT